jgi:hypothetical protein
MLTGIFEIDTGIYKDMIRQTHAEGGNLLVFGQAGIGKTEIPFQVAQELGIKTVYWNLSTQEAPDLVGLPIIKAVEGAEVVRYAAPEYMPIKERTPEPLMVIVDELDKAKADLQNPLLEVFHSRTINGRELNIKCIVATGNLPDENSFSKPVSMALANRCGIYRLKSDFDAWQAWAANNKEVQAGPGGTLIVGFLHRNREYLSRPPVEGDPTAYTRCSPRAWTKAAHALNVTNTSTSIDFQTLIVAGRVGQEPAAKFRVWLDHYRHIEPLIDALVKKGDVPNVGDMTIDRVLVLALSACGAIGQLSRKTTKGPSEREKLEGEVQKAASNVFKLIEALSPEFQVAAVKSTLSIELVQDFKLTKIPAVMKAYLNVRKAMKD